MIIKATTTNPATRFCTMAATPGELMNKATGANSGDQRRGSAPSRADHGAGAEMISRGRAAKESTTVDLMAVQTCCRAAQIRCAIRSRVFENSPVWPPLPRCWCFRGERPKGTLMISCSCTCRRGQAVLRPVHPRQPTWQRLTRSSARGQRPTSGRGWRTAARLRQARWAASLHKMRHCGPGAFDVRLTLNSGAKSDVAGCPSWI